MVGRAFLPHFAKKVFSGLFAIFSIVNERQTIQSITDATHWAIFFFIFGSVASAQAPIADLILINGNIRTLDRSNPRAEAVAISGGKIIAVGTNRQIRAFARERTRVIDARGRLVLPGFNDAHVHFAAIGNKFSSINLKEVRNAEEMAVRLAEYAKFLPKGRWILGGGFNAATVEIGRLRRLADAVTADNPVFVYSSDAKAAFANGAALSRAGRGADGEPNGILSGAAMKMVASLVPADHTKNWPEILETASNYAASLGVTSVQDMHSDELADVYRQLEREGKLKTRVYDCSPLSAWPKLAAAGTKAATGDAMVRTGCIKYLSEGEDAEVEQLNRSISAADKAGLQVMIHAIGDRANSIVLDAFEIASKLNGRRDRRFRIEHAHNVKETDRSRFRRSHIIASMQPWLFFDSDASIYKKYLAIRTPLAFGSDASITDFNPLFGIYAASSGAGAMSVKEAVRAYTTGSAYAEFQENVKGTIEAGKLADFVIVDRDIFRDHVDMRQAKVSATFVDGVQVYASK